MGAVIGKAADGIGGVLGNVLAAPFKSVFGGSCEKRFYLCLATGYHSHELISVPKRTFVQGHGIWEYAICQCIIRSLCKICWTGCKTYWFALEDITCFLWHKLKNTKRVNRHHHRHRHFEDIEEVGFNDYYLDKYDYRQQRLYEATARSWTQKYAMG
ncbi:uncharacterized protein LOC111280660 [Durio zibethinus]|uniref:Uncharacterized protein LOC111280660 n=1 Tax=Durio zibethinus TaxID=66656 RepID=A0A6P5X5W0_DURZI|nr:uncharacterized protein LOC111280660 [Durio zibethinus]